MHGLGALEQHDATLETCWQTVKTINDAGRKSGEFFLVSHFRSSGFYSGVSEINEARKKECTEPDEL